MAGNRRPILTSPSEARRLLSDGHRHGEWVTGTRRVLAADPHWPDVGARLKVRVGAGPLTLDGTHPHARPPRSTTWSRSATA
ncbi:hypothetical protein ACPXCS_07500 [Streptomyces sp. DT190]|uniref:hypothetical protein n=1 Tax=unclassified Streptomyces TaxID=2593676 RepID=UPI003CED891E